MNINEIPIGSLMIMHGGTIYITLKPARNMSYTHIFYVNETWQGEISIIVNEVDNDRRLLA